MQTNKKSSSKKRRPRRSAEQWRTILARFEQGDLSFKDFCRQEDIPRDTFQRWRNRFLGKSNSPVPGFLELHPPMIESSPGTHPWSLELDLPGGGHLRIRSGL